MIVQWCSGFTLLSPCACNLHIFYSDQAIPSLLWRHIDSSWWRPWRGQSTLVACLMTAFVWEGQNLSSYQILARHLNPRLSYYYFRFRKQMDAIWEFYFRFRFWPTHSHRHLILPRQTKFRPNRIKPGGVIPMRRLNSQLSYYYFRFRKTSGRHIEEAFDIMSSGLNMY